MGDERPGDPLAEAAIRMFRIYVERFVEPLGICPWAAPARRDGRVRERVVLSATPIVDDALAAMRTLDAHVEIGILIFPRVTLDRAEWARFVAHVREADTIRAFAMAEFHPEAPAALEPSGKFVSFLRRTPDPTIQLVRQSALERVREGDDQGSGFFDPQMLDALLAKALEPARPPLHDRVEKHNRETIAEQGLERIARLLDEIRRERDVLYASIETRGASPHDATATR
jgi:hypothetical protein